MAGILLTLATVLCEISSHGQTLLGNDSKILENDTFATHDFHNVGKKNVKSVAQSSASQHRELKEQSNFCEFEDLRGQLVGKWLGMEKAPL